METISGVRLGCRATRALNCNSCPELNYQKLAAIQNDKVGTAFRIYLSLIKT